MVSSDDEEEVKTEQHEEREDAEKPLSTQGTRTKGNRRSFLFLPGG